MTEKEHVHAVGQAVEEILSHLQSASKAAFDPQTLALVEAITALTKAVLLVATL